MQELMRKLGVTLADISAATGMSEQLISAIVRGNHPASPRIPEIEAFLDETRKQRITELVK